MLGRMYILKGRKPVQVHDPFEFSEWFHTADRTVGRTRIGNLLVSTVFLGIDHSFGPVGKPILFETMAFIYGETHRQAPHDVYQKRFATWSGAERHHKRLVQKIRWAIFKSTNLLERQPRLENELGYHIN